MNSLVQSQQALGIARPRSTVGDAHWLAPLGVHISRYALVLILFWIGIQKFTLAEAEGIRGFKSAMKEEEKPADTRTIIAGDQS